MSQIQVTDLTFSYDTHYEMIFDHVNAPSGHKLEDRSDWQKWDGKDNIFKASQGGIPVQR